MIKRDFSILFNNTRLSEISSVLSLHSPSPVSSSLLIRTSPTAESKELIRRFCSLVREYLYCLKEYLKSPTLPTVNLVLASIISKQALSNIFRSLGCLFLFVLKYSKKKSITAKNNDISEKITPVKTCPVANNRLAMIAGTDANLVSV